MKRLALLLLITLICSALPGLAQDSTTTTECRYGCPSLGQTTAQDDKPVICVRAIEEKGSLTCVTISGQASAELAQEPGDSRLKAQIAEAKDLLREKASIEKRVTEIQARLTALDNDADPLSSLITTTGVIKDPNCGWMWSTAGGTGTIQQDIWGGLMDARKRLSIGPH